VAIKMASAHDNFEKGLAPREMDSGSDKAQVQEVDRLGQESGLVGMTTGQSRDFQAPEFIRNMTPEERHSAESRLKAKIDLRLMPMIILMYIMNYLDRVSGNYALNTPSANIARTTLQQPNWQEFSQICISRAPNSMLVS
jgi:hypothetical protein